MVKLSDVNRINKSPLPQMGEVLGCWSVEIYLITRLQNINSDGFQVNTVNKTPIQAVVQPLKPQTLVLKPEILRGKSWLQIHIAINELPLELKDAIEYESVTYKVNDIINHKASGYIEYHVVGEVQA